MIKKLRFSIAFLFLTVCLSFGTASAETGKQIAPEQVADSSVDTGEMDRFWKDLMHQYGDFLPIPSTPHFLDVMKQEGFSLKGISMGMIKFLFYEILQNSKLLGSILILAVLSALLENLQNAFERNTVSQVAFAVVYMALIILSVNSFMTAIGYAKQAINAMSDFMVGTIPLLLTLMASTGAITSAGLLHPVIVFAVNAFAGVINFVVFPLIFFSAILQIVSEFSSRYKLTQLANLLKTTSMGILGFMFSAFIGVMAVKGAMGGVADGVALRTAKFVSSTFMPVVGKMFSDSMDTVVGASLIVKNSVGVAGLLILTLMVAFPALKIISLSIIYNLSAALMQPLGNSPIISSLSTIGKTLSIVFASLATVAFMFFLSITMILVAGNISLMVR